MEKKELKEKQSVVYKGKIYKIHSFPLLDEDKKYVYLRKYRKDGLLDARDKGVRAKITEIKGV